MVKQIYRDFFSVSELKAAVKELMTFDLGNDNGKVWANEAQVIDMVNYIGLFALCDDWTKICRVCERPMRYTGDETGGWVCDGGPIG